MLRLAGGALAVFATALPANGAPSAIHVPVSAKVWAVDPEAADGGSGRLEAPFNRLVHAGQRSAPGDWIIVLAGELDEGIELKIGQHLVGRGVAITLADGTVVPAAGPPRIGTVGSAGVRLADGCSLRGLELVGNPPVLGRGIRDLVIDRVRTIGGEHGGVVLDGIVGSVSIEGLEAVDSAKHGLAIRAAGDDPFFLSIRASTLTGHRSAGVNFRAAGSGEIEIEDNTIDGNALGVVIAHNALRGTLRADIVGNRINTSRGGSHTALQLYLTGASTEDSTLETMIDGNLIGSEDRPDSGSRQGQGIELYASGAGTFTAEVTDNRVRAIGYGSAFRVVSSSHTGILDVVLRGNDGTVHPSMGTPLAGLEMVAGTTGDDRGVLRVDLNHNIAFVGGDDLSGVTLSTIAGQPGVELAGYRGAVNNLAAIEAFLNTAAASVSPSAEGRSTIHAGTVSGRPRRSDRP